MLEDKYHVIEEISSTNRFRVVRVMSKDGKEHVAKEVIGNNHRLKSHLLEEVRMLNLTNGIGAVLTPNVVDSDGSTYFVMEKIDGENLSIVIKNKIIEKDKRLLYLSRGLDSVEVLVQQGYFHNDIKPENFQCSKDLTTYLLDLEFCETAKKTQERFDKLKNEFTGKLSLNAAKRFIPYTQGYLSPIKIKSLMFGDYPELARVCEGYSVAITLAQTVLGYYNVSFIIGFADQTDKVVNMVRKNSSDSIASVVNLALKEGGVEIVEVNNAIKEYLHN